MILRLEIIKAKKKLCWCSGLHGYVFR